jgi:hypothetical protein
VTRGWRVAKFKVANDTAGRDLKRLTELGILMAKGKGRAVRYVLRNTAGESTENQPMKYPNRPIRPAETDTQVTHKKS